MRIWATFLLTMQIPDYLIKAIHGHYKRIVENAKCAPSDTKTANALRLAKGDLRKLEKIINERKPL